MRCLPSWSCWIGAAFIAVRCPSVPPLFPRSASCRRARITTLATSTRLGPTPGSTKSRSATTGLLALCWTSLLNRFELNHIMFCLVRIVPLLFSEVWDEVLSRLGVLFARFLPCAPNTSPSFLLRCSDWATSDGDRNGLSSLAVFVHPVSFTSYNCTL